MPMQNAVIYDDDDVDLTLPPEPDEIDDSLPTESAEEAVGIAPPPKAESIPAETVPSPEEDYGKRVQKRINQLIAQNKQLEQRASQKQRELEEKYQALEAKMAVREFSEFQSQLQGSESDLKQQIEEARRQFRRADEEGEVEAKLAAIEKISQLNLQLAEKQRVASLAEDQARKLREAVPQPRREEAPPTPQNPPAPDAQEALANLPEGTRTWLQQNRWYVEGTDPRAMAYARQIDEDLQAEGFSPEDPGMYEELDRRLHVVIPRLAKKTMTQETVPTTPPVAPKPAPKARVASSSADGQGEPPRTGAKRSLTTADLETMRRYGMDPRKPEHRRAWLKRNDPLA